MNSSKSNPKVKIVEPVLLNDADPGTFDNLNLNLLATWQKDANNLHASLTNLFLGAAQNNQVDEWKTGMLAGIPLNVQSPSGYTPLLAAASGGANDTLDYILALDANPAHRGGHRDYDALCVAAAGGHFETAVKLLAHKADPETIDSFKQSILQIAIEQNHFEFARKWIGLMEKQERLNLQHMDRFGRNALMTALGCFFRDFTNEIESKNRQEELEKFCLFLMKEKEMKAFDHHIDKHAKPPAQIIIHSQFAFNLDPDEKTPSSSKQKEAMGRLYLEAPKLAKFLYDQAGEKLQTDKKNITAIKFRNLYETFDAEKNEVDRFRRQQASSSSK